MKFTIKTNKFADWLLPLCAIVVGCLFFIPGNYALNIILTIIGVLIFVFGLIALVNACNLPKEDSTKNTAIALAIIEMVIGLVFGSLVWILISVFTVLIGIFFILLGIYQLFIALADPITTLGAKLVAIIISALYILVGVFLFFTLDNTMTWASYVIGALLVLDGVSGIIDYFAFKRVKVEINNDSNKQSTNNSAQDVIDVEATEHKD